MLGDDPPYLSVGTEVSAKYKGAFCEAKIRKVVRSVKCRVTYKQGLGTATVTDEQIRGTLRVGASVEARHADKKDFVEATITKIQDCSQYTVVFDDGDITTLRRTALCLKSGRHFAESETLDQLPLTHPEHFGNPVIGGRRGRRSRQAQDDSSEDEESPPRGSPSGSGIGGKEGLETEPEIGRVVCVELGDKKKKDNWFPGLVVAPTAQDTVRIRVRDDYLVRSFKDARYYTVPKKEATEFTKELGVKVENSTLKLAVEKALLFLEKNELPPHWDRDSLFGNSLSSGNSDTDGDLDSDSSDDEPREEKDHFVAQLYKFMDDRGTPINNCPMIGSEDIDLYRLFRAVYKLGGYNRVTNQNQWKSITRRLGLSTHANLSTHNLVKQAYKKFLHSFEDFYRKLGCTMVNHPRGSTRKQRPGRSLIRDKDRNTPVPPLLQKSDKEREPDEDKKSIPEEEKKPIVPAVSPVEDEPPKQSVKKKEPIEEQFISGPESDVNIEVESTAESSSSEKSQKPSRFTPVPSNRSKAITKPKEEPKKKSHEKKKQENASSSSSTSSQSSSGASTAPVMKKEKSKDEDSTKTRSKSKEDTKSKESRETRETSRESEKTRGSSTKQRRLMEDDLKKQQRGRKKRKDSEKSRDKDDNSGTESSAPCYKGPIQLGDRLKVYYGPTHESKVTYEAKVIEIQRMDEGAELDYLVHYTGWNTRYDEWIKATRIAQNFTQTQGRVKRTKATPRPQTPSTNSSAKGSKTPSLQQTGRRRAQSVAPSGTKNSSSGSSTGGLSSSSASGNGKEKDKDKDKEPTRSTTPLSVASSGSRTKSPATPASRPTRNATRNAEQMGIELRTRRTRRMSGHTDLSVATESEDSDAYETDNTEPERARTRSRGTEERRRREVRRRVEDRIKPDENSEVEDEKDPSEEVPRRTRRLRRAVKKIQDTKSEEAESGSGLFADETDEPEENEEDNDNDEDEPEESESVPDAFEKPSGHEEAPKGRDFDLNQIRSELKGFDKAVKLEVIRMEPENSGDEDIKPKVEDFEKEIKLEPKEIKKEQEEEEEEEEEEEVVKPIVEEVVAKPPASPSPTTEDVYEFKEPEPFEFEVRNKRDSGADKDKTGLKKRVFDEEPKSPKKKQKTAPPVAPKEIKQEPMPVASVSAAPSISSPVEIEPKKKPKRSPVIKRAEDAETPETSVIKSSSKEFDKSLDAKPIAPVSSAVTPYIPEDATKSAVNSDILFLNIPGNDESTADGDDLEDRLVISESEITEVDEKPVLTFQLSSLASPEADKIEPAIKEEKKELPLTSKEKEEKILIPVSLLPSPLIVSTSTTVISNTTLSATSAIERRILEAKIPSVVALSPSTPLVPAPISARLPATSTIEEKLSAAALAFRQQKPKDSKREEDAEQKRRDSLKKSESATKRGKQISESVDGHGSKQQRPDDKKKDSEDICSSDVLRATMKHKEEELEQPKVRKDPGDAKVLDHRRMLEKRQIDPLKEISESTELEKQKRKKMVAQEFLDSTDSSDSEQKLVIDNCEEKCDKIVKTEKPDVSFDLTVKPSLESTPDPSYQLEKSGLSTVVVKHEEEGENMNLLCEEEIPGSPAPAMEVLEQEDPSERGLGKDKLEKKIVILEMPFASAPTSGAQSTSQGSGLSMTVASSCGVQGASSHGILTGGRQQPVQAQVQQVQGGVPALQVIQNQNRRESNEAAPVMDNTPPTTPDSTISNVSESPRGEERAGGSSPTSEDTAKSREEGESEEVKGGGFNDGLEETLGVDEAGDMQGTEGGKMSGPLKRPVEDPGTPKKRKRNRKNSECGKEKKGNRTSGRTTRQGPGGSDSDDTSEGSNAGGSGHVGGAEAVLNGMGETLGRDHKSLKYNFFVDLDPELDGCQRIALLQQKLSEIKKTYNIVKTELAAIERRRKKLRRREREAKKLSIAAMKAAKAEMQQACA
ncbi:AT-rich interactive domain-containing protein 4B isoform X2 [Diachasma alloeum]|uniref:AT-rich interactive domain-containing protein 4B isoform X2 n=1 Tax=Diachasma alloeum TaxID=454923 RepID=UPI000738368A|nr:AT-rich interactive domain-containing protein 4B isoform X2 [Diachasma alloeum]